jgi:hypothetical protein
LPQCLSRHNIGGTAPATQHRRHNIDGTILISDTTLIGGALLIDLVIFRGALQHGDPW